LPTDAEFAAMRHDVETARFHGAAGVVIGILKPDATVDRERTATLVGLARPMSVTFHKAFDEVRDPVESLDVLRALGIDRLLTSGCRAAAIDGLGVLKTLVDRARDRITILAGGRISPEDVPLIVERTGVREIHVGSAVTRMITSTRVGVDAARVRALVAFVSNRGATRS
jgi:copper homeostasis protein